jgi:hypothetical protein
MKRLILLGLVLLLVAGGGVAYYLWQSSYDRHTGPTIERPPGVEGIARTYQPVLSVSRRDGFWPVSALTIPRLSVDGRRTCLRVQGTCRRLERLSDLPWVGDANDSLEYPAALARPAQQRRSMIAALGDDNPFNTSQVYVLQTGGGPGQTTSLQYWFYYTEDYQPIAKVLKAGFHEGDVESIGILLSRETKRPVYIWMARHGEEGGRFAWNEPEIKVADATHPEIWTARGSHASYESCHAKLRHRGGGFVDDQVDCGNQLSFNAGNTPLADLAKAPWACWSGYLGHAFEMPLGAVEKKLKSLNVIADAPRTPLWQQSFDRAHSRPCASVPAPVAASDEPGAEDSESNLPDATAAALRARSGRYDSLFNSCEDWEQRPTGGGYLMACDQGELNAFVGSGLEAPSPSGLHIESPHPARGPTVPAVYRSSKVEDLQQATISVDRQPGPEPLAPTIYASAFSGHTALAARFRHVELRLGEHVQLRIGKQWRLVDSDGHTVAGPTAPRAIGRLSSPPPPTGVEAARSGTDGIVISFKGARAEDLSFSVFTGAAYGEDLNFATAVPADADGTYTLRINVPGANVVRVIAERFGRTSAAATVRVLP